MWPSEMSKVYGFVENGMSVLSLNCTSIGGKSGTGRAVAHFIVAIAQGQKLCSVSSMWSDLLVFADFIREHF